MPYLEKFWYRGFLILCFLLTSLLLFRNPFSNRTLIPNFEPYPDSFHYLVPAINLWKGNGLFITRAGGNVVPTVPPLYSLVLSPFLGIGGDPRWFYLVNILGCFATLFAMERIMSALRWEEPIKAVLLFALITSLYFTWLPTLTMAENLLLPLTLFVMWLFLQPVKTKNTVLLGAAPWLLYATKYAAAPMTGIFVLASAGRLAWGRQYKQLLIFLFATVATFGLFSLSEYWQKGSTPLLALFNVVTAWLPQSLSPSTGGASPAESFFSFENMSNHLPAYLDLMRGVTGKLLWRTEPLLPSLLAQGGLLGLALGFLHKKHCALLALIVSLVAAQVLFMSTFYVVDARFLYHLVPFVLLGLGFGYEQIVSLLKKHHFTDWLPWVFSGALGLLLLGMSGMRLKSQIVINLRYSETPWYYLAVLETNRYFSQPTSAKEPIFVSAMQPFLYDFYGNGNYHLLPLSDAQDFRGQPMRERIWGPDDYSDLPKLYQKYLDEGHDVYVGNYGLGNESALHASFANLQEKFTLVQKQEGCYNLCNIYQVLEKKN